MTAPPNARDDVRTLLEKMPWRGKFTKAETEIFQARRLRLVDAMTDAVGVFGQVMYTDPAHLELLAVHIAMAGDFFDDGHGRFIEYRVRDGDSDSPVMYEGVREWRKCGEFGDEAPPPAEDDPDQQATALVTQINRQLSPEVRRKMLELMTAAAGEEA